jgi:hypothetical protein
MKCERVPFRRSLAFSLAAAFFVSSVFTARAHAQEPAGPQEAGAPITATGELTVMHADDFDNRRSELIHMVRDERTGKSFRLRFGKRAPEHLQSGMKVTARGRGNDSEIYLAAADPTGETSFQVQGLTSGSAGAVVSGDQKTLVMLANFRDKVLEPRMPDGDCSAAAISDLMFTSPVNYSVDDMYRDTSHGNVSFSGAVVGPYTLNALSTDSCDISGWAAVADAQAVASGVDVSSYPRKLYVIPRGTCPFSGVGEMGGASTRSWVYDCDLARVYAHELGHNLGMDHASTEEAEYGDYSDIMGTLGMLRPVNAPHSFQMGWTSGSQVQTITQDGQYEIAPLAVDASAATVPQVLKVSRPDTTEYYYVSYRYGTTGFEANNYDQYLNRLSVHRWSGGSARTYLLANLADGESFTDPATGFTVTQVNHNSSFATARIQLGTACGRTAPSVTLTPRDQSGPAGSALNYDVAVVNNDATTCAASTFALTRSAPSGWTSSISAASVQIAPGTTGHATLTMTSPAGAAAGLYGFNVTVSDSANPLHNALTSGTYAVATATQGADTVQPTAPAELTARVKNRAATLSWQPASDNVAVAGYRVWRDGIVISTTTSTTLVDGALAVASTYTYFVTAYDAAGNLSAPSNNAAVTVSAGGKGK